MSVRLHYGACFSRFQVRAGAPWVRKRAGACAGCVCAVRCGALRRAWSMSRAHTRPGACAIIHARTHASPHKRARVSAYATSYTCVYACAHAHSLAGLQLRDARILMYRCLLAYSCARAHASLGATYSPLHPQTHSNTHMPMPLPSHTHSRIP